MVWGLDSEVGVNFLEDINQRRRRGYVRAYGEAQAVGLAGAVVGVLAEDNHAHLIQRCTVQGVEAMVAGGEQGFSGLFLRRQEVSQLLHVGLAEFVTKVLSPAPVRLELACQYLHRLHGSALVFLRFGLVFRAHGREQDDVANRRGVG